MSGRGASIVGVVVFYASLAFPPLASAVPTVTLTVQTDKTVYQLGEEAQILYSLHNSSADEMAIVGDTHDDWMRVLAFENAANRDRSDLLLNERAVWGDWASLSYGRIGLGPGETYGGHLTWGLADLQGRPVGPGEYELVGVDAVYYWGGGPVMDYTNAAAAIIVLPEPGMLALTVGAGVVIVRRRKATFQAAHRLRWRDGM